LTIISFAKYSPPLYFVFDIWSFSSSLTTPFPFVNESKQALVSTALEQLLCSSRGAEG